MCNSSKLIVNGVLCYISTARQTQSEQTIVNVCQAFYNSDVIREAKELLYSFTEENIVSRRGDSKVKADLTDILSVYRKLDDGRRKLPKFVADCFKGMPPSSGFEILAEHMVALLTEVATLKTEIAELRSTLSDVKINDVVDVKEELYDIKICYVKNLLRLHSLRMFFRQVMRLLKSKLSQAL